MSEDQKLNNVMKQQLLLLLSSELSFKNQTSSISKMLQDKTLLLDKQKNEINRTSHVLPHKWFCTEVTQKKSGRLVLTVHDLFETYFPCKSTDNTTPDITEVETEEQRPVSG
ncbi:hypothetical protein T05_6650 [Trichinella murrelli]|uniref:Uncharacterized protein n=1 Tax=Trichinella murrelli TaxID=144512 RepID=A0A0V0UHX3_9BILA|nr:hypothetical protein T05_6650 [Trichinella murrelli]